MALEALGPKVDWSVDSAKVAAGDVAALLIFVIIGEFSHNIIPFLQKVAPFFVFLLFFST